MFYQLPPAGNPVCLRKDTETALPLFLSSQKAQFYDSGTAALAAAIAAAIKAAVQASSKLKNIEMAEVIMPAYACPDLVSAAIYAGVKPVLVDLEANRPWLDLTQLADAITSNTVAIIAVNLFGLAERWPQLRELVAEKELVLIEDSAQYFPGDRAEQDWQGDLTVLSFGRGKPVSLLGGGAVLCNNPAMAELLPDFQHSSVSAKERVLYKLKARLYNAMISPTLYWLPQALPFLHLGETRYHTLPEIKAMDKQRFGLLATNIRCYQGDNNADYRTEMISLMLERHKAVVNLPRICNAPLNRRLLRYPILLDAADRNRIYQNLKRAGLGASLMYPTSLPKVAGLNGLLDDKQRLPNAEAFASQLITLPTHSQMNEKDIDKIDAILKKG